MSEDLKYLPSSTLGDHIEKLNAFASRVSSSLSEGGYVSSSASVKVDDLFTVFPEWAEVYGDSDEQKAQFAKTIARAGDYARLTDAYNDARNGFEVAGSLASGEWVEVLDGETIFDGKADVIETPNKVTRLVEKNDGEEQ